MPAADKIHEAVKNALIKDGWTITADPFTIEYKEITVFADLAAERLLAARQGKRQIVVEIKSFVGKSRIHDLEVALGQYVLYRNLLPRVAPDHQLYLAVSEKIHGKLFTQKAVQFIVSQENLRILVVNLDEEVIVSWRS